MSSQAAWRSVLHGVSHSYQILQVAKRVDTLFTHEIRSRSSSQYQYGQKAKTRDRSPHHPLGGRREPVIPRKQADRGPYAPLEGGLTSANRNPLSSPSLLAMLRYGRTEGMRSVATTPFHPCLRFPKGNCTIPIPEDHGRSQNGQPERGKVWRHGSIEVKGLGTTSCFFCCLPFFNDGLSFFLPRGLLDRGDRRSRYQISLQCLTASRVVGRDSPDAHPTDLTAPWSMIIPITA